jgi:hypothetical protein
VASALVALCQRFATYAGCAASNPTQSCPLGHAGTCEAAMTLTDEHIVGEVLDAERAVGEGRALG